MFLRKGICQLFGVSKGRGNTYDRTLAFADYRGNFQYLSIGNLSASDKACLFLIDYTQRARLKIYVHAEAVALDADSALTEAVVDDAAGRPERIIRLRLKTFDWNCPQHITPRYTEAELQEVLAPVRQRLAALEAENARLRQQHASTPNADNDEDDSC